MRKLPDIQRIVLRALSASNGARDITGVEIVERTGLPPQRGLAGALIALYKKNWVECRGLSPITYRITKAGRDVLKAHPSEQALKRAEERFGSALKSLASR